MNSLGFYRVFVLLQDNFLGNLVQIGLVIGLAFLLVGFLYQGWKTDRNAPFLTTAVVLGLIGQSLALTGDVGLLTGVTLVCWSFVLIYLHFESLASIRPHYWFFGIIVGFAGAVSITGVLALMPMVANIDNAYLIQRFLSSIACILAIGRSTQIVIDIRQHAPRLETTIELAGVTALLVYRILFLLRDSITLASFVDVSDALVVVNNLFTFIGLILALVGIGIIMLNYTIYPDFIYRLPFPVHSIMIYNNAGMPVYNRRVHAPALKEHHEMLVSGALTAISQLINDTLGSGAHLRHIDADEYQIFLVEVGEEQGTLAAIVTGGSLSFRRSLTRFLDTVPEDILAAMNRSDYEYRKNQQIIDGLIMSSFPYLEIPDQ